MDYVDELIEKRKIDDPEFAQIWAAAQLVDELAMRRAAMGLSQQAVAERMGVKRSRVSEIENHPERVSFARIICYAISVGAYFTISGPDVEAEPEISRKGRPVESVGAKTRLKRSA